VSEYNSEQKIEMQRIVESFNNLDINAEEATTKIFEINRRFKSAPAGFLDGVIETKAYKEIASSKTENVAIS
jgi:hypothetical protein